MESKTICCVVCPSGCQICVTGDENGVQSIEGYGCARGKQYASDEFLAPKRVLTTTVRAEGYVAPVIPVRSVSGVPKELLLPCMQVLRQVVVEPPFTIGKVVVPDILGCGVDIVLSNA